MTKPGDKATDGAMQTEYQTLLKLLPKELTDAEIAAAKTDYQQPVKTQMIMATHTVERDGRWYGALIFIHILGVVGAQIDNTPRATQDEAADDADRMAERIMDFHERHTGVRHRGIVED